MQTRPEKATGEISVLNRKGDTKHWWDEKDAAEVEAAREVFQSYLDQGFTAARLNPGGEAGEVIREFDASAGVIIFMPQMAGG